MSCLPEAQVERRRPVLLIRPRKMDPVHPLTRKKPPVIKVLSYLLKTAIPDRMPAEKTATVICFRAGSNVLE